MSGLIFYACIMNSVGLLCKLTGVFFHESTVLVAINSVDKVMSVATHSLVVFESALMSSVNNLSFR